MDERGNEPIMGRRVVWITRLIIMTLIFGRWFMPGSAQDTSEQRIDDLETRVAVLEDAGGIMATPVTSGSPSPVASPIAATTGANPLWQGTYLDRLPTCDTGTLCLVALDQWALAGEYYFGVVHNDTADMMQVRKIAVTLRDGAGAVAAAGYSVSITPMFVAPGDHALVLFTIQGDRDPSYAWEATFDAQAGVAPSGYGAPVQIANAAVRGDAIVGEITNTTPDTLNRLTATSMCFDANCTITDRRFSEAATGPYPPGATATFSIPNYVRIDCTNFVVVGTVSP
jgi:hypothetical protein